MTETLSMPRLTDETTYGVLFPYRIDPFALPKINFPALHSSETLDFARMINELELFTGWKDRGIAKAIGTSHPTVAAIQRRDSGVGSRNPSILKRLQNAHTVISRIYEIAGKSSQATAMALTSERRGRSAIQYLAHDQPERAYLVAMEALRPRPGSDLLVGSQSLPFDDLTVAYRDED